MPLFDRSRNGMSPTEPGEMFSRRVGRTLAYISTGTREAVFLSDRVLVMSERPGRIIQTIDIPLPRPRGLDTMATQEFIEICNGLREHFSSFMKGGVRACARKSKPWSIR